MRVREFLENIYFDDYELKREVEVKKGIININKEPVEVKYETIEDISTLKDVFENGKVMKSELGLMRTVPGKIRDKWIFTIFNIKL